MQAASVKGKFPAYYKVTTRSIAGVGARPPLPLGIVVRCAHSDTEMGIVSGRAPRERVERLLQLALETPERTTAAWQRARGSR